MFRSIPKFCLVGISGFLLIGCSPESPQTICQQKALMEIVPNPSISAMASRNPYLARVIADELRTYPYDQYDQYFVPQSPTPIKVNKKYEADQFNPTDNQINPTDNQWIFSPDCQKAVGISVTTREGPDSTLDIYNRQNDNRVEQLEFCGTPCKPVGAYWINKSNFVYVRKDENFDPTTNQRNGQVLVIEYYDLLNQTITPYRSNKLLPDR